MGLACDPAVTCHGGPLLPVSQLCEFDTGDSGVSHVPAPWLLGWSRAPGGSVQGQAPTMPGRGLLGLLWPAWGPRGPCLGLQMEVRGRSLAGRAGEQRGRRGHQQWSGQVAPSLSVSMGTVPRGVTGGSLHPGRLPTHVNCWGHHGSDHHSRGLCHRNLFSRSSVDGVSPMSSHRAPACVCVLISS